MTPRAPALLTYLERKTRLDVGYYLRGSSILFLTQAFIIVCTFLLTIGFAHLTSKEVYGQFQFIISFIGMFSLLSLPGANNGVVLGSSLGKDGALAQGVRLKFLFSLLAAFLLFVASIFVSFQYGFDNALLILVALPFFPFLYSLDVVHSYFAGRKKFSWTCGFQLITEAGSALAALALLYFTRNILWVVIAYFSVRTFGDIAAYFFAHARLRNHAPYPRFGRYSFHLTVINGIPYVKSYFDKILSAYYLGFIATAIYSIASAVSEQLYAVAKNIGTVAFPKIVEHGERSAFEIRKRLPLIIILFSGIALAAILLCPIVIPFFFSNNYADAVPLAQLLLLAGIPRATAAVISRVFESSGTTKKLYTVTLIYSTVEIAALVGFVPFYGLYGFVIAKAISQTTYLTLAWRAL